MSDIVKVALITAIPPTLAVLLQWFQQWRAAKKARDELERNKQEAIAAREALKNDVLEVHALVNSKSDAQISRIEALETELRRVNASGGTDTPTPAPIGLQPPVTLNGEGNIRIAEKKEP